MTYLWNQMRVQGGAYGCFALFDRQSGAFNTISYRDPAIVGTLETYAGVPGFLRGLEVTTDMLEKAILAAISDVDTYQLPDARGYTSLTRWLLGETNETRQALREGIFSTTKADFADFADVLESAADSASVVVVGSEVAMNNANAAQAGLLTATKVL
jgi:hypothetical protein